MMMVMHQKCKVHTQPVEHLLHTALFLYYSLMDTVELSVLQNKMTMLNVYTHTDRHMHSHTLTQTRTTHTYIDA